MNPIHFVLTGCARSGTTYTATVLSRLGVPCTHEELFGPRTTGFGGWGAAAGDSSWLAVPFLHELPEGTVVLHQLRDPKATIDSLCTIRLFDTQGSALRRELRHLTQVAGAAPARVRRRTRAGRSGGPRRRRDFVRFLKRWAPEAFDEDDERSRAARYWITWNRLAARAATMPHLRYRRLRLEDLDVDTFESVLADLGAHAPRERVQSVLAEVPSDTNTRAGLPPDDARIADELLGALRESAAEYGYPIGP